ncbi:MAG TPA: hypothetical protein IGR64_09910, partial [Leptolyngbyaceae cyanobacterium M65_K2018_010]|nr:hypothetical protein [Leptolyngbyaceae cyanobacterium M65_K2018_010]
MTTASSYFLQQASVLPWWQRFLVAVSVTALVGPGFAVAAQAEDFPVTERSTYVNVCRRVNTTTEVFNNSRLGPASARVGTITAGTNVTLTGVLDAGRAQVFLRNSDGSIRVLGWVNATNLGPCSGNTVASTPAATASSGAVCYRAATNLTVRSAPNSGAAIVGAFKAGDTVHATTNPPTEQTSAGDRRVWTQ